MKKYIAYYRKSTDVEDKQIPSLDDQQKVTMDFAGARQLYVPRTFQFEESCSAKAPGRPVFNEVVRLVKEGKADGIISYSADRLTRNGEDSNTLITLIESGIEIWTSNFGHFENNSTHKLMFGFLALMAKLKVDGLSEDTKRGLNGRAGRGWWPGWAPLGYLNIDVHGKIAGKSFVLEKQELLEKLGRKLDPIEIDPLIGPFIKRAYELYAYGDYSLKSLCDRLYEEGLRTRKGQKIKKTSLEQMLKNPFYYGIMVWHKEINEAFHAPIIDKTLFDKVKERLAGKSPFTIKPKLDFLYKGLLNCGVCGCAITAEERHKEQQNGNQHDYIYYHCTKSKGNCGQPHLEEKELEKQLSEMFNTFFLNDKQAKKVQEKLEELFKEDSDYQVKQEGVLKTRLEKLKNEKKLMFRKMVTGEIDDKDTFTEIKNDIQNEILAIEEKVGKITGHSQNWFDQSSNLVYVARHARELFLEGTKEEKHTLVNCVASNLFLKDKIVNFELKTPFKILTEVPQSTTVLPGLDSDQRPYSYNCPSVTKRIGLSHDPWKDPRYIVSTHLHPL